MTATDPQPSPAQPSSDGMRPIYWLLGVGLLVLVIVGLISYGAKERDEEAQQKAAQLMQAFEQAGLTPPVNQEMIERSLGNDGGAVCANPANALGKAILADSLANGASFVGRRPVIADRRILLGQALILEIYCPEELEDYREKIDQLKTDDTIKR